MCVFVLFVILLAKFASSGAQVDVLYNISQAYELFKSPPPERSETVSEMGARGAIAVHDWAWFGSASNSGHNKNTVMLFQPNMTNLSCPELPTGSMIIYMLVTFITTSE